MNYIANNHFDLSLFDLGDAVGTMLSGLPPIIQYVMEKFQIVSGIFLVLNAYLARFAYRLVFRSIG
ncbi:hypothetical protein L6Q21_13100 [Sandaracinobacter sp. RS1-74]|uniref:hypothetical protein n=1 Tax=Sandaracinobacteroides sayramensis TaxID=2913411 RepID=UPI001EDAB9A0|nr:hypothetical protein [Sandaracinobacteroides sayramensis]MCG2841920.1 hypothetical protein [Sandaracinobacteroides sayramensis]